MTDSQAMGMFGAFFLVTFLIGVGITALMVWPIWRIVSKTGFHGALSLLMLVPVANIIMLFVLAFSEWPVEKELQQLRAQMYPNQYPPQPYPPQPPRYPQA